MNLSCRALVEHAILGYYDISQMDAIVGASIFVVSSRMRIIIPGGAGHLGHLLANALVADGHDVVILTRRPPAQTLGPARFVAWNHDPTAVWAEELASADAVINLAGRSVNCRYTKTHRQEILSSRVETTRALGEAFAALSSPPPIWLQMSTATIYAHSYGVPQTEVAGTIGGAEPGADDYDPAWNFSIQVATAWEQAATDAVGAMPEDRRPRLVLLRTAMVMDPAPGGAFAVLRTLTRHGLGGTAGHGWQWMSWIHGTDFVSAIRFLLARSEIAGPVNLAAPNPLPNREFMAELRRAIRTKIGLPAPGWLLPTTAAVMGTEPELLLKSRRVVPERLLEAGFEFTYPAWPAAVTNLIERAPVHHRQQPAMSSSHTA